MNSFGKERRLLKKNEYDYVFSMSQKIVTAEFIILYRENTHEFARLGLALSKKMIAKSHDRNRVKRLLRETFRTKKNLPSVDVIVLARKGVGKVSNLIINGKIGKAWEKLSSLFEI